MANNKKIRFGPVALSITLTTNILNPNVTSLAGPVGFTMTQPYLLITHVRVVNKHASTAAKVSLWLGATGGNVAGTEVLWFQTPVAVGQFIEWFGALRLDSADFLVGGSDTATALTIEGEGEIGIS